MSRIPLRAHFVATLVVVAFLLHASAPFARAQSSSGASLAAERQDQDLGTATAARYAFHVSFWLNLHNFLYVEARLRQGIDDSGLGARGNLVLDTSRAHPAMTEEARRWSDAVERFRTLILPRPLPDSVVIVVENRLARTADSSTLDDVDLDPALREVLRQAAPAYRALWWRIHDARDRSWIATQREYLDRYGVPLLQRLASVFQSEWPADPVRVDATVYANWFGAYTTLEPAHITISTSAVGSQGSWGLEVLVHETGHLLLAPVDSAIAAAARRQGRKPPPFLSHLLLFHTAGALVRELVPEHVTYAEEYGIWAQNATAREYQALLRDEWQPYLEGTRGFAEAIERLVRDSPP
jgi:hypothetical protein